MSAPGSAPVYVKQEPGLAPPPQPNGGVGALGGVRVKQETGAPMRSGAKPSLQVALPSGSSSHGTGQAETPGGGFALPQTPRTAKKHHHHHHSSRKEPKAQPKQDPEVHVRELRQHLSKVEELVGKTQLALGGRDVHVGGSRASKARLAELGWSSPEEDEEEEGTIKEEDYWIEKDDDQCRAVLVEERETEGFFGRGMVGRGGCTWRWPRAYMLGKEERRAHGAAKARKRAREAEAEAVGEGGKKFVGGRRPGGLLSRGEKGCVPSVLESCSDSRVRVYTESGPVGYIDMDDVDPQGGGHGAEGPQQAQDIGQGDEEDDGGGDVMDLLESGGVGNLEFLDKVEDMEVEAEKSSSTTLSVSENDSVLGPLSKIESAAGESLFGNGAVQDDPSAPDFQMEPVDFLKLVDPRPVTDLEAHQHKTLPPNGMAMLALQEGVLSFQDRMFQPAKVYNHDIRTATELPHCVQIDSADSEWIFALKQKSASLAGDGSMRKHIVQLRLVPHLHDEESGEHLPWDHYLFRLRRLPIQVRVEPECFIDTAQLTHIPFKTPRKLGECLQTALRSIARHLRCLNFVWEEIMVLREAYGDAFVPEVGPSEAEDFALTVRFVCVIDHAILGPKLKLRVPLTYPHRPPAYEFIGLSEGLSSSAAFVREYERAVAQRLSKTADSSEDGEGAEEEEAAMEGESAKADQLCLAQIAGSWIYACARTAVDEGESGGPS